jgi:hypothetical protein
LFSHAGVPTEFVSYTPSAIFSRRALSPYLRPDESLRLSEIMAENFPVEVYGEICQYCDVISILKYDSILSICILGVASSKNAKQIVDELQNFPVWLPVGLHHTNRFLRLSDKVFEPLSPICIAAMETRNSISPPLVSRASNSYFLRFLFIRERFSRDASRYK